MDTTKRGAEMVQIDMDSGQGWRSPFCIHEITMFHFFEKWVYCICLEERDSDYGDVNSRCHEKPKGAEHAAKGDGVPYS